MRKVVRIRYISTSRMTADVKRQLDEGKYSYDPVRDDFTEWIVVPDDDPRAETVAYLEASKG